MFVPLRLVQRIIQVITQQHAVTQVGQNIMLGEMTQAFLYLDTLTDILARRNKMHQIALLILDGRYRFLLVI